MKKILLLLALMSVGAFGSRIEKGEPLVKFIIKSITADCQDDEGVSYTVKDNKVYYDGHEMIGADSQTMKPLSPFMAKDKDRVYYSTNEVEGADPKTIKPLSNHISKDKRHVYFETSKIKDADPKTIKLLGDFMIKDKNHVYILDIKIDNLDAKTFEALSGDKSNPRYKDKNGVYSEEELREWLEKTENIIINTNISLIRCSKTTKDKTIYYRN